MQQHLGMALKDILTSFLKHVEEIELKNGEGYGLEFQKLKDASVEFDVLSSESGEADAARIKNRYKDILPFDHSRVVLSDIDNSPGSDYINASFIQNCSGHLAYIAAQAPLLHTLADFWRMIYQYKVKIVIMACNEKETGRQKCERYWPNENEEKHFGKIVVTLGEVSQVNPFFLVRSLNMKAADETRVVYQFHYTGWPDHGIPHSVQPLLEMIRLVREYQPSETIPIVIHCSAGCGRTGTICMIDYSWSLLRFGKLNQDFSVFNILLKMRQQRKAMVQTKDQYILVHRTLAKLFKQQIVLIENNFYENVNVNIEDVKSEEPKSSSGCNQRLYDINNTVLDYVNVCEEDSILPKLCSTTKDAEELDSLDSNCSSICNYNSLTHTFKLKDLDSQSNSNQSLGKFYQPNMESEIEEFDYNSNSPTSPNVSALKSIFDVSPTETTTQNCAGTKKTINGKNISKLMNVFTEKEMNNMLQKTKTDNQQENRTEDFTSLNSEEIEIEFPDTYKNVTVIAQKNIDQITKTVERYPRGAIIDLTSTSSHQLPDEKIHFEFTNETEEKSIKNLENKKVAAEAKKALPSLSKFVLPTNLKLFLSNHSPLLNNDSKEKIPICNAENSNNSQGISLFKRKNNTENKQKISPSSPKSHLIFSFSNSIKLAGGSKQSPPLSPKHDLAVQNTSKNSNNQKLPKVLGHSKNYNQSEILVPSAEAIQSKLNNHLKLASKNHENSKLSGNKNDLNEDHKDKDCSLNSFLKNNMLKKENSSQILKPPRRIFLQNENLIVSESRDNGPTSSTPNKSSTDIYSVPEKKKDRLNPSTSPESEDNNNSLYAEVNIIDRNFDDSFFGDSYDNFDSEDDQPPAIPEKLPVINKPTTVNSSTEGSPVIRLKKNLNPLGFFQKVAKKAEGVFSSSSTDPPSSTSEASKMEIEDSNIYSSHTDLILCFPHPFPKKPKGPRSLPNW